MPDARIETQPRAQLLIDARLERPLPLGLDIGAAARRPRANGDSSRASSDDDSNRFSGCGG